MRELDVSSRMIKYFDTRGQSGQIKYDELMIQMGEAHRLSLSDCIAEEIAHIEEFQFNAAKLSRLIRALNPIYDEIEKNRAEFIRQSGEKARNINRLSYNKRIRLLDTYYTLNGKHDRILRKLTDHLLDGSEADQSAHSISLIRRSVDYTCRVMRRQVRKNKRPSALHAIESARGAARNGLRTISIIATLLHDVLEERLDEWTEQLIDKELADPLYGDYSGKQMKGIPLALRHKIIQKHIDAYNDRATGIFFGMGLTLYDHIRRFPVPGRHFESLHSIAEMVAALSRRRDQSYYSYLQELLYPKPKAVLDTIEYERLREELELEHPRADDLLDPYLNHVHTFYQTRLGQFSAKEEVRRNAFREILAKILDRLNNTRDMERGHGFSIASRLYGTAFKNIFFLQAIEDKFRKPSFNTEERRLIEVKFLNKPKVAALCQILDDIRYMQEKYDLGKLFAFLEKEIERYMPTRAFRHLTPPGKAGYFNGLIYLFNDITMGRKSNLIELEKHREKIAEVLVAFKAVLESFLVYPVMIREEEKADQSSGKHQSRFRPYRISGMGPGLERRSSAREENKTDVLTMKTFIREVI
jgi:hypothetical protein